MSGVKGERASFRNYDRLVWLAKLLRAVEFRVLVALRGVGIGVRRGREWGVDASSNLGRD